MGEPEVISGQAGKRGSGEVEGGGWYSCAEGVVLQERRVGSGEVREEAEQANNRPCPGQHVEPVHHQMTQNNGHSRTMNLILL